MCSRPIRAHSIFAASRLLSGPIEQDGDVTGAITTDPETMHGVPVFRGTRVPVQTLFDYLEGGDRWRTSWEDSRR